MDRRKFLEISSVSLSALMAGMYDVRTTRGGNGIRISDINPGEDVFGYMLRTEGNFNIVTYRQIIGACNPFKEGDMAIGVSAENEETREHARSLLANTAVADIVNHPFYEDELYDLVVQTTDQAVQTEIGSTTVGQLKTIILTKSEDEIKEIMPGLTSDVVACVVKLMSNDELTEVGQKVFNPLPGSKIGAAGYMGARIQPNSPTDNIDDIVWQVFSGWSYAVGDVVLGTNPVSSQPESVAAIEEALFDLIATFGLEDVIPNCVLSHIDIQAEVEQLHPGKTGVWFQSLAGTVDANATFDVTIEKMQRHASVRNGQYGMYFETGQGADFTNGHGGGFDMVVHESRKYGFARALKKAIEDEHDLEPWVHVNDVAGFIGPEVFKTKEQLVRCCLEDTVMGKLHGLTIGLDICSTLHMDVSLDDLEWCMDQIMPANPAYLMALPTRNDPMLSYLTTSFADHVRIREKFNYKVNDAMWEFFKSIDIIDKDGRPTKHFGDPTWVYYQYLRRKNDTRSASTIKAEGEVLIKEIEDRGVPIAYGYGQEIWDLRPDLKAQVEYLYHDAKESIWTELPTAYASAIGGALSISTRSDDRVDYIYHPESGEALNDRSQRQVRRMRETWSVPPDVQIVISDGLNARSLVDEGHLDVLLPTLENSLRAADLRLSDKNLLITNGRVRAGYQCGELLFGSLANRDEPHGIIHLIGERPGSGHHNFSAYITVARSNTWSRTGTVDHNITRVVSGISDTALTPEQAVQHITSLFVEMFEAMV